MTILVDWFVEPEELYEVFDMYSEREAANLLKIDLEIFQELTEEEWHNELDNQVRHRFLSAAKIVGLEEAVDVPVEDMDPDDITEWLSNTYGYLVNGWTTN